MKLNRNLARTMIALGLLLAAFGAGCAPQTQTVSQAGPRSWIDAPLDSSVTFTDPLHPANPPG